MDKVQKYNSFKSQNYIQEEIKNRLNSESFPSPT
jgi:hypothetical protein